MLVMQIARQLMAKLFAIQLPRGIPLAQSQSQFQSFRFHFEECPSTNRTKAAVLMYACISSACSLLLVRTCVYGNYGNCLVWASASRWRPFVCLAIQPQPDQWRAPDRPIQPIPSCLTLTAVSPIRWLFEEQSDSL